MCVISFNSRRSADWGPAAEAMGRATARLEQQLDTFTTGSVGVLVRPAGDQSPQEAKAEVEQALSGTVSSEVRFDVESDEKGHPWVVIRDGGLAELAAAARAVGSALSASDLGERVIAAIYPFTWNERRVYWIYQPRVRGYTPFAPLGTTEADLRDHQLEVRMETAVRKHLPTSQDIAQWYPIWDMPV